MSVTHIALIKKIIKLNKMCIQYSLSYIVVRLLKQILGLNFRGIFYTVPQGFGTPVI